MELLTRLLPQVLREDRTFYEVAEILSPKVIRAMEEAARLFLFGRIDTMDEELLSHLAYQFHVDFYDETLPLEKKRAIVKASIRYHRKKGTPKAVEDFLSEVFSTSELSEWFEYGGKPYFFKVKTRDRLSDDEAFSRFFRALYTVKNTRSWLEALVLEREKEGDIYAGGARFSVKRHTYLPFTSGVWEGSDTLVALAVPFFRKTVTHLLEMPSEIGEIVGGAVCGAVPVTTKTTTYNQLAHRVLSWDGTFDVSAHIFPLMAWMKEQGLCEVVKVPIEAIPGSLPYGKVMVRDPKGRVLVGEEQWGYREDSLAFAPLGEPYGDSGYGPRGHYTPKLFDLVGGKAVVEIPDLLFYRTVAGWYEAVPVVNERGEAAGVSTWFFLPPPGKEGVAVTWRPSIVADSPYTYSIYLPKGARIGPGGGVYIGRFFGGEVTQDEFRYSGRRAFHMALVTNKEGIKATEFLKRPSPRLGEVFLTFPLYKGKRIGAFHPSWVRKVTS